MPIDLKTIGPLDKVTLQLRISSTPTQPEEELPTIKSSFIYGIGVQGVTPFEKLLFGKTVGDQIDLTIEQGCQHAFLGHLGHALLSQNQFKQPVHLNVTVLSVLDAESHEVVKAMAQLVEGCGGSCDCGCGCG
ncbi:MAG: hypothetical protein M0036_14665 [Desulfobacteraceae bacterium]|nr:hypothetical protein [Desulfobacteraceae bacterium]